jgi:hypothetical protein
MPRRSPRVRPSPAQGATLFVLLQPLPFSTRLLGGGASVVYGRVVGHVRGARHDNSNTQIKAHGGIADHRATLANHKTVASAAGDVVASYDPSGLHRGPGAGTIAISKREIALHDPIGDYRNTDAAGFGENAQSLNDRSDSREEIDPDKET